MLLSNFTLVYIIVGFPFPRPPIDFIFEIKTQVDLPREACHIRGITQMIINVVVGMLVPIDLQRDWSAL